VLPERLVVLPGEVVAVETALTVFSVGVGMEVAVETVMTIMVLEGAVVVQEFYMVEIDPGQVLMLV